MDSHQLNVNMTEFMRRQGPGSFQRLVRNSQCQTYGSQVRFSTADRWFKSVIIVDRGCWLPVSLEAWVQIPALRQGPFGGMVVSTARTSTMLLSVLVSMFPLGFPTIKIVHLAFKFRDNETFFPSTDVKQQTIYEYHRVEINTTRIVSGSAFEFTPLPSKCPHTQDFDRFASLSSSLTSEHPPACLQHTSCELCMTSNLTTGCGWCNTLQR